MKNKKTVIASDIHGSSYYCEKLIEAYKREKAEMMILLGDILYHGPRNDLPERYDCKKVIEMLNGIKDDIICVRGNCDSEVDQMVLDFPLSDDSALIENGGLTFFATHGHIYNKYYPPSLSKRYILLTGHTHVPACEAHGDFIYCNPGSVSIPKSGSKHSYILFDDGKLIWKDLDGNAFMEYTPESVFYS